MKVPFEYLFSLVIFPTIPQGYLISIPFSTSPSRTRGMCFAVTIHPPSDSGEPPTVTSKALSIVVDTSLLEKRLGGRKQTSWSIRRRQPWILKNSETEILQKHQVSPALEGGWHLLPEVHAIPAVGKMYLHRCVKVPKRVAVLLHASQGYQRDWISNGQHAPTQRRFEAVGSGSQHCILGAWSTLREDCCCYGNGIKNRGAGKATTWHHHCQWIGKNPKSTTERNIRDGKYCLKYLKA